LAASADLEALATETLALGREFSEQPESVKSLIAIRSIYDVPNSITYMLPVAADTAPPIADTEAEVQEIVRKTFPGGTDAEYPELWKFDSTVTDKHGLYFVATVWRAHRNSSLKLIYVIPRPAMMTTANLPFHAWFERVHPSDSSPWPSSATSPMPRLKANVNASIHLGNVATDNKEAFAAACDVLASFMTHYAQVVIDREIQETPDSLKWSGRFACLRQTRPRFFEQGGGGSSLFGGGGWDFQRIGFEFNRKTRRLTLSAEPIEYPVAQLAVNVLAPAWATTELKLMEWKPLESLDYFGQRLFPPEYQQGIDAFDPNDASRSRQILYHRYHIEQNLPRSEFILGLLYERARNREKAVQQMNEAARQSKFDPATIADVARWELEVGRVADARKNAEAALRLWPEHPVATDVIRQLDDKELSD
jgi:hypothetical protein